LVYLQNLYKKNCCFSITATAKRLEAKAQSVSGRGFTYVT